MVVAVPADSATVWVPGATFCTPVVPPSPTSVALAWPSMSRLNFPLSVAGASTLVTLIVLSRVFVYQHLTHS